MIRVSRSNLSTLWQRPRRIIPFLIRYYNYCTNKDPYNSEGINVFDEDWDNLVILDACRYDYFQAESTLAGDTSHRISRGSMSAEFIRGNFTNRKLHDTVYISANGFYPKLKDEINAEVYSYIDLPRDAADNITTHPSTVTNAAIKANDDNPNKKLLIHYLQPHQPYLGEFGRSKFEFEGNLKDSMRKSRVTQEDVRRAYVENLNMVLDEVASLSKSLNGKTVVTADHGEMLGEKIGPFGFYGHFSGLYRDELVKVPWHVLEYDSRKDIVAKEPVSDRINLDEKAIDERLKDLGYKV